MTIPYEMYFPSPLISRINGVVLLLTVLTLELIWPISVCSAVATTIPRPLPLVTAVEANAELARSPKGVSSLSAVGIFKTESASPVSAASWIFKLSASTIRRSAGTWSPASKKTRSPATSSSAGTSSRCPSRTTVASTCNSCLILSTALEAFTSWK